MNITRLASAGIRNINLLFVPAGLPLVAKAGDAPPTTSILVRGGPGTGKTTMAIAMAQAIAVENGGALLHLTTEFSPAEVVVKALLLGLAEDSVFSWDRRADAKLGAILVEHLMTTSAAESLEGPVTSTEQKRHSMEAVWRMLADPEPPAIPIRAVVIDAFNLPDAGEKEGALRSDLVPFIQALEQKGITTVLVEEAIPGGPDWLAFVTDIVFELSFQADADTGDLQRKLVCKKSRYAQATPGPHDYGLDARERRPSVFPDPLLPLLGSPGSRVAIPKEQRASLFIPWSEDGDAVVLRNGALVLNPFDRAGGKLSNAFRRTPDIRELVWECGPLSTLTIGDQQVGFHTNVGPYAACNTILDMLDKGSGNAVEIHNIGSLTSSARYRTGLPRVLEALRRQGYLVLLHGTAAELAPFGPFADADAQLQARGLFRISPLRYCAVTVHLPSIDTLSLVLRRGKFDSFPTQEDASLVQEIVARVRAADGARSPTEIETALRNLNIFWDESRFYAWNPWVASAYFLLSVVKHRLGVQIQPQWTYIGARLPNLDGIEVQGPEQLLEQLNASIPLHGPLAWAFSVLGNTPAAAHWCLAAFEGSPVMGATMNDVLWCGLQAVHAQSSKALEVLLKLLPQEPYGPLCLGLSLRALVVQNRAIEIDAVVSEYVKHHPLPEFFAQRLRLEPLLGARDVALREKAKDGLLSLADATEVPSLHRAEIFHNVGFAHERLGKISEARQWYERARTENPHLSFASEALARFDRPRAPLSTANGSLEDLLGSNDAGDEDQAPIPAEPS